MLLEIPLDSMNATVAYATSFAKYKVPFANTIANFRGRASRPGRGHSRGEPSTWEFSDDAHMMSWLSLLPFLCG